jgi:hypothetical protein
MPRKLPLFGIPLTLLLLAQFACSQTKPLWIDEAWRSANHPASEWYTGFSQNSLEPKAAKTLEQLERDAQNKMAESIIVRISSQSTTEKESNIVQKGKSSSETLEQKHKQEIQTSTSIEIAASQVRSYHDSKTNRMYAFATVKKKDLANFYRSNINSLFAFAEKEFFIAEQLAETGKKKQALAKIETIEDSLKNASFWAYRLQLVESDNSHAEQEKILWQRANNAKMQMKNGTTVYLDISGNNSYGIEQLGAQLQEKDCNCTIVEDIEKAEYVVKIKAKLGNCNEGDYQRVYCYANATLSVNNPKRKNNENVSVPEAKGVWASGNKDKATEEAFKLLAKSLTEKIIQTINQ